MIPKNNKVIQLSEFRPISLYNRLSLGLNTILKNKLLTHAILKNLVRDE